MRPVEHEPWLGRLGARHEELDRPVEPHVVHVHDVFVRDVERWHAVDGLRGRAERLTARGDDAHAGTGAQQRLGHVRGRFDHVLAVVEHDEHPPTGERLRHPLTRAHAAAGREPERTGNCVWNELRIGQRCQLGQPDAVGEVRHEPPRDLERQPGLSNASGAG